MTPTKLEIANIPPYFRCPISLNLMSDPVSLCTGITYDRVSIERWFDDGNTTCPATMQHVHSRDLTPNHTLRRLIQEWCVKNLSQGVERIPTPKQPADLLQVQHSLQDITDGYMRLDNLQRLHSLARESEKNRRCVLEAGAVPVLASVLASLQNVRLNVDQDDPGEELDKDSMDMMSESVCECEEALGTLALLPMNEKNRKALTGPTQLDHIKWFLVKGSSESRVYAASLLGNLTAVEHDVEFKLAVASQDLLLEGLVSLLKEGNSNPKGAIASLKCFVAICSARKNRLKAIDVGVVPVLVDKILLMPDNSDNQITELAVCVLELLCACAEGRAAVCDRPLAITALVKIVLRQSKLATEHALAALWSVCRSAPDAEIQLEAVRAGLFTKLLVLVQSDHSPRTKAISSHLLRLLQNTWRENSLECFIVKPL
ncbi:hypothetical protein BDL97_14G078800 [Sphagnum fallax]|jgi:hypothetical protein|nr:hypothetical protein BDL97_14G078800 [Sphagnum fallax]